MNADVDFTDVFQQSLLKQIAVGDEVAFRQVYHQFYKKLESN
jgi:hypothetical protein